MVVPSRRDHDASTPQGDMAIVTRVPRDHLNLQDVFESFEPATWNVAAI